MNRRITILFLFLLGMLLIGLPCALAKEGKPSAGGAGESSPSKQEKKRRDETKKPVSLVKEVRFWSNPDYTRVAISLDAEATFESHQIKRNENDPTPSRLYIDVSGAKLAPGLKDVPVRDGFLKSVRVGQYRADVVRIVLDVENIRDHKVFSFADPFQIVVDVKGERPVELTQTKATIENISPVVETVKAEAKPKDPDPAVKPKPGKIRRIVVDAGHGGHDPGAVGAGGTFEKDVVLSIAQKVTDKLRKELGIDVVMTRSADVFLELTERTAIANKVNADLFVSVHANAALNRNVSGIETYYLNLAKSEKAAQLAARENNTSLEKVSVLQAILFDLMVNYKINDSAHLAEEVQKGLVKKVSAEYPGVKNHGVKQGPFYVLVGATMPSILVEVAFLSNEKEEARLRDPAYQELTARGIFDGIKAYIAGVK